MSLLLGKRLKDINSITPQRCCYMISLGRRVPFGFRYDRKLCLVNLSRLISIVRGQFFQVLGIDIGPQLNSSADKLFIHFSKYSNFPFTDDSFSLISFPVFSPTFLLKFPSIFFLTFYPFFLRKFSSTF